MRMYADRVSFNNEHEMAEVLHANLAQIEASDIHARLGLEKGKYILLSVHREENRRTSERRAMAA